MKKIGIFGGSFDPVHFGHLILAEQMREKALLDEVIFIPTYLSPFKTAIKPTKGEDRLKMLALSFGDNPYFKTSDIELKRGGVSYTFDTLSALQEENKDSFLYFIMGSDAFLGLEQWHRGKELLSNFHFLVGIRKGIDNSKVFKTQEAVKKKYNADVSCIELPELEISSSNLRFLCQAGKSLRYLTPFSVIEYIKENELYTGLLEALENFAKEHQSPKRFIHTKGVVDCAKKYSIKYGADEFKAQVAAWFHDNYKAAGNLEHGAVAAEELKKNFGINDKDIYNALYYHTTGRPGMSILEKVIKLADSLEPSRDFPGIEEIRTNLSENIDETLLLLLKRTKEYVLSQGQTYDKLSQNAIDFYEGEQNG